MELGLLVSGNLGLIVLMDMLKNKHKVLYVFTDFNSVEISNACDNNNIACFKGNPRNNRAADFLSKVNSPQLLLSVNYLFIVEQDIISKTTEFAVNIHGALLPTYRGRTPHIWAIINNEKQTGITAHLITAGCDEGDILYQEVLPINESETGNDLLKKFNARYPIIVEKIISIIENGNVELKKQDNFKATYFEKRTPSDGLINWNWQKERIKNWVRAQANPYPGSFTFYNGEKIIIHKIEFSELGFHQNDKNGKIISVSDDLIVKTSNGAVKIVDFEIEKNLYFKLGDILDERH
ncbi:MAG: formyltransferase family protein [Bacteroidia bacterium]